MVRRVAPMSNFDSPVIRMTVRKRTDTAPEKVTICIRPTSALPYMVKTTPNRVDVQNRAMRETETFLEKRATKTVASIATEIVIESSSLANG